MSTAIWLVDPNTLETVIPNELTSSRIVGQIQIYGVVFLQLVPQVWAELHETVTKMERAVQAKEVSASDVAPLFRQWQRLSNWATKRWGPDVLNLAVAEFRKKAV